MKAYLYFGVLNSTSCEASHLNSRLSNSIADLVECIANTLAVCSGLLVSRRHFVKPSEDKWSRLLRWCSWWYTHDDDDDGQNETGNAWVFILTRNLNANWRKIAAQTLEQKQARRDSMLCRATTQNRQDRATISRWPKIWKIVAVCGPQTRTSHLVLGATEKAKINNDEQLDGMQKWAWKVLPAQLQIGIENEQDECVELWIQVANCRVTFFHFKCFQITSVRKARKQTQNLNQVDCLLVSRRIGPSVYCTIQSDGGPTWALSTAKLRLSSATVFWRVQHCVTVNKCSWSDGNEWILLAEKREIDLNAN